MDASENNPKVYISYSWSSPEHERWVREFGRRLMEKAIEVSLDKWDLKEGQDKFVFMEKMVNDDNITKVLIISDKEYMEKADKRKGGVGTETQIVSKEIYEKVDQEKFIPIVRERLPNGDECLPAYLKSRIYIDFSNDETYERNFKKLVRNIYGQPTYEKPELGTRPEYTKSSKTIRNPLQKKTENLRDFLLKKNDSSSPNTKLFFSELTQNLIKLPPIDPKEKNLDDWVIKSIEKLKPIRNSFIDFSDTYFEYEDNPDIEIFKSFFMKLIPLQFHEKYGYQEVYKFLSYELFLYLMVVLFKHQKFAQVHSIIKDTYFYKNNADILKNHNICIYNRYVEILDKTRNQRLKGNRTSITADLIKERADFKDFKFDQIREIDIILRYLTCIQYPKDITYWWYPRTSVYSQHKKSFDVFEMMISKEYFRKAKKMFGVNSQDELINKLNHFEKVTETGNIGGIDTFRDEVPSLKETLDLEKINTI